MSARILKSHARFFTHGNFNANLTRSCCTIVYEENNNANNNKDTKTDLLLKSNILNSDNKEEKVGRLKTIKTEIFKSVEANRSKFEKLRKQQLGGYGGGYSQQNDLNEEIIQLFLSWYVNEKNIIDVFVNCPLLWQTSRQQAMTTMKVLGKFLYTPKQSVELMKKCPQVLTDPEAVLHLQKVLGAVKSFGIEQKKAQIITLNNPDLISTPIKTMKSNFNKILEYFVKSETILIATKCPNVLSDDWAVSDFKLQYAFHEMGLTTKIIAQSRFFSHGIEDILTRHKLLTRLGYYSKPNPKIIIDSSDNPKQREIFQDNDYAFLKNIAKISRGEFEAFKESIRNEMEGEKENLKEFFVDYNGEVIDGDDSDLGSDDDDDDDDEEESDDDVEDEGKIKNIEEKEIVF